MTPRVDPVADPVIFRFDNGATQLITTINPDTHSHCIVCDLCDKSMSIGPRASGIPIMNHRGTESCQKIAFKRDKKAAKERILVR